LVTAAAPVYKNQLTQLFPKKNIQVVLNGYFENLLHPLIDENRNNETNSKFIISYAGLIYDYQPIESFLETYKEFINNIVESSKVELVFYGLNFYKSQLDRVSKKCKELNIVFRSTARLKQVDLYAELTNSSVFLVLGSPTEERLAAKVFDYILLKKKIILFQNDLGILEQIISDCNAGIAVNTKKELKNELLKLYDEFKKSGKVKCETKNIEHYSRENQTKIFSELVNSIT
jgi:hypothetical protein